MPFRVDAKRNAITGSVLSVLDVLLSSFVLLGRCANQIRALASIAKGAEDGAEASIARCSEMLMNVVRMSRLMEASAVSGEARSSRLRVRQALRLFAAACDSFLMEERKQVYARSRELV